MNIVGRRGKDGQLILGSSAVEGWVPEDSPSAMRGDVNLEEDAWFGIRPGKTFLGTLNGTRDFAAECRRGVTDGRTRSGQFRRPALTLAPDEDYSLGNQAVQSQLGLLVDEWIESGFDKNGVETPKSRELKKKGRADKEINRWLWRNKPAALFTGYGSIHVMFLSGGAEARFDKRRTMGVRPVDDPVSEAVEEATRLFVLLLQLPLKYAIADCFRCRQYYFRKKLRKHYKRETYCADCRASASAMRRTSEVRKREQAEIIAASAKAVNEWPRLSARTRARYGDEQSYIVGRVKKFGVTGKWVTRNMTKIEQLTGATNAKG